MTGAVVLKRVFDARLRGIRWVEIVGAILVAAMVLSVYVAKAAAARESSRISELEREIAQNHQRVRLLRSEIARLEQPARLEALSRAAGLGPVDAKRQATEAQLTTLKAVAAPAPAPVPAAPDASILPTEPGGPQ